MSTKSFKACFYTVLTLLILIFYTKDIDLFGNNYYKNIKNSKNKKFRNKKPEIFRMILRSYARNVSTEVRRRKILDDINEHDDRSLDVDTFDEYIEALNDLFIIKDIESWNPNFRSKTAIMTSPTRHFVDTSIAAGALGVSPDDLMNDPKTFGLLYISSIESLMYWYPLI